MWQMLKEMLQGGQEMKGKTVQKEAFSRGSSGSVPTSAAGREAMPGTVTGGELPGNASPLAWLHKVLKPLEPPAGVSAGRISPAPGLVAAPKPSSQGRGPPRGRNKLRGEKESLDSNDILEPIVKELQKGHEALGKSDADAENPPSTPRVFCPQDVRRTCMIGTVVTLFTVPLAMVLCYVGFRWWKGRKHRPAAAPAPWPRRRHSPSPPGSPRTVRFDSSQTWPQRQQSPRKAEHQPSVPPPRPPSPAMKRKLPEIPPPPPLPSQPPWSS